MTETVCATVSISGTNFIFIALTQIFWLRRGALISGLVRHISTVIIPIADPLLRNAAFLTGALELVLGTFKRNVPSVIAIAACLQFGQAVAHRANIFFPSVTTCHIPWAIVIHTLVACLVSLPGVLTNCVDTLLDTIVDIAYFAVAIITPPI